MLLGRSAGHTVAVAGAGGKHTLMAALAAAFRARDEPVIVTSTTHLHRTSAFDALPAVTWGEETDPTALVAALQRHRCALVISQTWGDQMWHGISPKQVASVRAAAPTACLLVKADGARKRLLKAPGENEPRWPIAADHCVLVLSLAACGLILDQHSVHRLPKVAALTRDRRIAATTLIDVIVGPDGYGQRFPSSARRILYLSHCDTPQRLEAARKVAAGVRGHIDAVVIGDTPTGRYARYDLG